MGTSTIREETWKTLYEAYYQELASESLAAVWERVDIAVMFVVALTATGSAVAGWTLWSLAGWRVLWVVLAGIASVASVAHGAIRVPSRVKDQGELRGKFSKVRFDLETFWQELNMGVDVGQAPTRYEELRKQLSDCMAQAHPDILFSKRFRTSVQKRLNDELKRKEYIK